jgi:hypothetical protein
VASLRLFTYPPGFDSAVTAWGDQSRAQTLSSHGWRLAIAFSRCGQTLGIVKLFAIEGVIGIRDQIRRRFRMVIGNRQEHRPCLKTEIGSARGKSAFRDRGHKSTLKCGASTGGRW